jgi:FSR family fosmidomycin resistance protein-like MFS transporter
MMILPVGLAFVQENFPNNRSLANGSFLAVIFGLNAIAGVVTGFMYDKLGGNSTFLISGLVSFLGIPFIFLLPKESKTD